MISVPSLVLLAVATATAGTLGGFGGAVLLVPILVLSGVEPSVAAPLGLVSVAAGSLAAAPSQLANGLVHHRLGITMEITASAAAITAAMASAHVPGAALQVVLALVALAAGLVGLSHAEMRNVAMPEFSGEPPAEWPGTLDGAYVGPGGVIPYRARHVGPGLVAMAVAGVVTGLSGVGGGFVKTPAMRELMYIPMKVAAATSTFTVAVTAASALVVVAGQGRIVVHDAAAVGLGGLVGGIVGSRIQDRISPARLRRALAITLILVAVVLVVQV
ncbi:MAG: sulfite exporter TauE/SafE family protein [Acidimicrobiia bacterium]|nr:sulfite exporter TauE/SafE family protein [Acidimicrobiia bacterium]